MTNPVRLQTIEDTGTTGDVFVRDTTTTTGGAWTAGYLTTTAADARYLKLDCSNDPLTAPLEIAAGTVATTVPGLKVGATLPNPGSSSLECGTSSTTTTAGAGASYQIGTFGVLTGTYTGTNFTWGANYQNTTTGTGAGWTVAGECNIGVQGQASGTTVGHNVGVYAVAYGSSTLNIACRFITSGNTATSQDIGCFGTSSNVGGGNVIGGYFGLDGAASSPTLALSAALVADNSTITTADIALFRRTGTAKTKVAPTGDLVFLDAAIGPVRKSPNGHYWRESIDNAGVVTQTDIGTTPP